MKEIGPPIIEAYRKIRLEKLGIDGYIRVLMGYARSLFQDFEIYLRIIVVLDENDIQLILKQYNEILSLMNHPQGFKQSKILQKLFTH